MTVSSYNNSNNNNNGFLCANTLEDRLSNLIIIKQCMSCRRMDDSARKLRRLGSIKEVGFYTSAE